MTVAFDNTGSYLQLYSEFHSKNGAKIAIVLEELKLTYKLHKVEDIKDIQGLHNHLSEGCHSQLPVLTDVQPDGHKIHLFETGAIMQYLDETYDKNHVLSYPKGTPQAIEVNNWLFFQNRKVSPTHEEAEHFSKTAPEKIQYGIDHFTGKALGLYTVLDMHLGKTRTDYMVGNKMTIADIALYPWVAAADSSGVDLEEFSNLTSWQNRLFKRESVQKGMQLA